MLKKKITIIFLILLILVIIILFLLNKFTNNQKDTDDSIKPNTSTIINNGKILIVGPAKILVKYKEDIYLCLGDYTTKKSTCEIYNQPEKENINLHSE